jgi:hypothetical protein
MIENKWTKEKQHEWLRKHTLTSEQARQRLEQKLERFKKQSHAQRKVNERLSIY